MFLWVGSYELIYGVAESVLILDLILIVVVRGIRKILTEGSWPNGLQREKDGIVGGYCKLWVVGRSPSEMEREAARQKRERGKSRERKEKNENK